MPDEKEKAVGDPARAWRPEPVFGTRSAYALALVNGVLTPVAFAGIGWWWLGFFCWVPLVLSVRGQTPRRALLLGWLAGLLQMAIGFYWLTPMLKTFSGFPLPLCVLFALILWAFQGGRIALCTYAAARAEKKGWHPGLSFAAAFALSELVYPELFPWYFGASFHRVPLLMQTAELGGPILVSLVFVGENLALAELCRALALRVRADLGTAIAGAAVLAAALVFGDLRMRSIDRLAAKSEPVNVGLVQASLSLNDHQRGLVDSLRLTEEVKKQGAELVVWSEAVIPGSFDVASYQPALHRLLGRRLGMPGVVSGVLYERIPGAKKGGRIRKLYNSAFIVDDQGKVGGHYDKQYLLMFGEYLPLGETFPVLYEISQNSGDFTPGSSFAPLLLGSHRIAAMICYEDILPSFVNKLVKVGEPDLLVNLTNDRWFQNQDAGERDTTEPIQHLALAKLRTIEHRMFLVRVSNSGVSAIVDPNGRVVVRTDTMKPEAKVGQARYMRTKTLYSLAGDAPWWAVSALVLVSGFVGPRRRKAATA